LGKARKFHLCQPRLFECFPRDGFSMTESCMLQINLTPVLVLPLETSFVR